MKLRALHLTNVHRFTGKRASITGIGDGITVVSEANEFGKSTFFDALHALFFEKFSSSAQPVKSLRPYAGGSVEVMAEVETDQGAFRVEKRFLSRKTARIVRLSDGATIAQDDEAERWISTLLGVAGEGPAGLLWVRQGLLGLEPDNRAEKDKLTETRRDLMSSVAGEIDAMTGGRRMDRIMRRVAEDLGEIATQTGRKTRAWKAAADEVEALEGELVKLTTQVDVLEGALPDEERDPSPVAGVQGKIAVVEHDGQFYLPIASSRAPTAHILKISPVDDPQITRHEVALLKIAEACGIRVAACKALAFDLKGRNINTILSTRFDREIHATGSETLITRVHSEDFCQALGLPPTLKYERSSVNPENSFSATAVARVAAQASVPTLFQRDFLRHTIFNLLVGNSDNHGKNASVIHVGGGTTLAPLYDVVPVFMDGSVTHQLAFRHGRAEFAEDFALDNLRRLLVDLGFGKPQLARTVKQIAALAAAIAAASADHAAKDLADGLHAQAKVVEAALGADFGLPKRGYFDRISRDARPESTGGWGGFS